MTGKLALLVALLRRPNGADLSDMMEATGWQQLTTADASDFHLPTLDGEEFLDDLSQPPGPHRNHLAGKPVSINNHRTTPRQARGNLALAGPDPAGRDRRRSRGRDDLVLATCG